MTVLGPRSKRFRLVPPFMAAVFALGGCAQQQAVRVSQSKEYFPSSVYGPASPRVVAQGEPVPAGGGQYMVGKPYTVAGHTYYPAEKKQGYSVVGLASYYGAAFHGRRTANGEVFNMASLSAAHPTMPLPSYARVTNLRNDHSIIVRVNDRGPYHGGRVLDVSERVADALAFKRNGTARVRVDWVARAGLAGDDNAKLLASLRTDGQLASLDGVPVGAGETTAVARLDPPRAPPAPASPEPQQSAALSEAQQDAMIAAADETDKPVAAPIVPARKAGVAVPLPPARPFDLATIPGAATPIAPASPLVKNAALVARAPLETVVKSSIAKPSIAKPSIAKRSAAKPDVDDPADE